MSAEMFLLPLSQLVKQFLIQVTGMVFLYPTRQLTRFVLGLIPKPSLEFCFKMGSGYETSLYLCTELLLISQFINKTVHSLTPWQYGVILSLTCQLFTSLVPRHQIFRAHPAALSKNRVWTLSLRKLGCVYIRRSVNWSNCRC